MAVYCEFQCFPLAVDGDTDQRESVLKIKGSGTGSAIAANSATFECSTSGETFTLSGASEMVGITGKAYLETGATFSNAAGVIAGVRGIIKVIGTATTGSVNCIVADVHGSSTGNINALFKGINSGSGTIAYGLDLASSAVTNIFRFQYGSSIYVVTPAQLAAIGSVVG